MMQLSKKIPFEDPNVLLGVRVLYVVSNAIILSIYLYTQAKINSKRGTSPLPSTTEIKSNGVDMTTLKYVEPAPMGTGEQPRPVTTTNMDYDKQQLRTLIKGQMMGVGMMGVMHLYFHYSNPLLIQSILPVKSALEANLVKIHVFGKAATGDLARPFKAGGGFMSQGEVKSDKASVEKAEKDYRGGVKEE